MIRRASPRRPPLTGNPHFRQRADGRERPNSGLPSLTDGMPLRFERPRTTLFDVGVGRRCDQASTFNAIGWTVIGRTISCTRCTMRTAPYIVFSLATRAQAYEPPAKGLLRRGYQGRPLLSLHGASLRAARRSPPPPAPAPTASIFMNIIVMSSCWGSVPRTLHLARTRSRSSRRELRVPSINVAPPSQKVFASSSPR